ncbi:putative ATP-grasp-modified RiPP [Streptomyces melanosporofaciens]|uniref:Putative ATP-grasp target RiPP n=1 Tax=Streptomyces melanosporofaciens TaxID=67327 RepID=A0A1H4W9U8_STRMJ|nr:putative ATP-grasp-modified RiPP [Streptomyces melanosporofaciens]SEC89431.1 putative ATP-grasp target RiPP [Streptomyces melanosporofaciens]
MTLTMDRTQTRPVRPFGLSKAVPVADETLVMPPLHLCPERQINVTAAGIPFINEPSMKTQMTTTTQTREDSQLATDNENDTD